MDSRKVGQLPSVSERVVMEALSALGQNPQLFTAADALAAIRGLRREELGDEKGQGSDLPPGSAGKLSIVRKAWSSWIAYLEGTASSAYFLMMRTIAVFQR